MPSKQNGLLNGIGRTSSSRRSAANSTLLVAMNQYWDIQQLVFTGFLFLAACGIGLLIGHFIWR
jgi:hypothetical protein